MGRLALEDFFDQLIGDVAIVSGEGVYKSFSGCLSFLRFRHRSQGDCSHLQADNPAFRMAFQGLEFTGG